MEVAVESSTTNKKTKQLGIRPPFSEAPPTEKDIVHDLELRRTLNSLGVFESAPQRSKRDLVLSTLKERVRLWSIKLAIEKNLPARRLDVPYDKDDIQTKNMFLAGFDEGQRDMFESHGVYSAILLTFGSYHLQVHAPDADIDILCVAPAHVTRADWFDIKHPWCLLSLLTNDPSVSEMLTVPEAYTPVIKFKMDGISIDMLFASLPKHDALPLSSDKLLSTTQMASSSSVKDTAFDKFLLDDALLIGLRQGDEGAMRSLNGYRVTKTLQSLVPNLDYFRTTLRCVKAWARRRGIYSNVLGFLGGINCAILVAFVCQLYPTALPASLFVKFFQIYQQWRWPEPIMLRAFRKTSESAMSFAVWSPRLNPRDGTHLMPIITPAYPEMNSAYNVGEPQLRRMKEEIERGHTLAQQVLQGKAKWEDIVSPSDFFLKYKYYVQVKIIASDKGYLRKWLGFCESRLRSLVLSIEQPPYVQAHPFADLFHWSDKADKNQLDTGMHFSSYFIALTFAPDIRKYDLTPAVQDFVYKVNSWDGRVEGMDLTIETLKRHQLPSFVTLVKKKRMRKSRRKKSTSCSVGDVEVEDDEEDEKGEEGGEGSSRPGQEAEEVVVGDEEISSNVEDGDGTILNIDGGGGGGDKDDKEEESDDEEEEEVVLLDETNDVKITFGTLLEASPSPVKKSKASLPSQDTLQSPMKKIRYLD